MAHPQLVVMGLKGWPGLATWTMGPVFFVHLRLDWAALTSQAASFTFAAGHGRLCILGAPPCGFGAPTNLEAAWQLAVHSSTSVPGLQGGHLLQNAAARLAGWTFDKAVDV